MHCISNFVFYAPYPNHCLLFIQYFASCFINQIVQRPPHINKKSMDPSKEKKHEHSETCCAQILAIYLMKYITKQYIRCNTCHAFYLLITLTKQK